MAAPFNFGAAPLGGAFGGLVQPAPTSALESVPSDAIDRKLYDLDRACGVGKAVSNPEVAKVLVPVAETTEKPLTELRRVLEPYRKTHFEFLDRLHTYKFRCGLWEKRDGDPKTYDPRLMTKEEWLDSYGESITDVKKYEESTDPRIPLCPIAVEGFDGLKKRLDQQDAALNGKVDMATGTLSQMGLLDSATRLTLEMQRLQERVDKTRERIATTREKGRSQLQKLLRVAQKTELIAFGGGGGSMAYGPAGGALGASGFGYGYGGGYGSRGRDENREEAQLREQLAHILVELRTQHNLADRVHQLQSQVDGHLRSLASQSTAHVPGAWANGAYGYLQPGISRPDAPHAQATISPVTRNTLERVQAEIDAMRRLVQDARRITKVAEEKLTQS